jgi:hypothetical protein
VEESMKSSGKPQKVPKSQKVTESKGKYQKSLEGGKVPKCSENNRKRQKAPEWTKI